MEVIVKGVDDRDLVVCPVVGSRHLGAGHLAGARAGQPTQLRTLGDGSGPGDINIMMIVT